MASGLLVDPAAAVLTPGAQAPSARLASASDRRSGNRATLDEPDRNFSIRYIPELTNPNTARPADEVCAPPRATRGTRARARSAVNGWNPTQDRKSVTTNANAFAGNPAVIGLKPLDRWLCVPGFCRVCPLVEMKLKTCSARGQRVGVQRRLSVLTDVCTRRHLTRLLHAHAKRLLRPGQAQYRASRHILRGQCQRLLTEDVGARELRKRAPVMDFRKCELDCVL
jgi:hypothetical protein